MERDMFDTMTMTKVVGALCGTLLIFLLGGWAAETIYHAGAAEGHGEEHAQAYVIPVEGGEEATEEVVEAGPPFEEVYATADAAAGEGEFRPCAACHKLEKGANGAGPYLFGVVGRQVDTAEGFAGYSGELEKVVDVWTPEHLNEFLTNPKAYVPGTAMNFRGIPDVQDRANLIAYLATFN
jgi:cytochrome c